MSNAMTHDRLENFYEQGYMVRQLPGPATKVLRDAALQVNLVADTAGLFRYCWDRGEPVPDHPDNFQKEALIADWTLKHCPARLKQTIYDAMATSDIGRELVEATRGELQWVDIWDGAEDIGWHWDGPAKSPLIALVYLTEQMWRDEWGGQLEIGRRNELPANWFADYRDVEKLARIQPHPGTWVWINNANPMAVHRPVPLEEDAPSRLTLTFGFG